MKISMRKNESKIAAGVLFFGFFALVTGAQETKVQGKWVSAWSAAVHTPLPFPGLPPSPVFENQTIRMVIQPTLGGQRLRIRLSNAYGSSALKIGSAHVALLAHDSSIVPESDRAVTFDGQSFVEIPIGAPVLSDPVDMEIPPFAEVSVSLYLPQSTPAATTHFWAQHETYVSGPGDFSAKADIPQATTKLSWYWLSDLEVWTSDRTWAVVALGDSITDGVGAKQGTYADWPDQLARRLEVKKGSNLAVLNEGIGGNRILYDGAGINALARFDRDVLAQPGVSDLIVLEGINDIGWPHMKLPGAKDGAPPRKGPFAAQAVTADELIAGLRQIIDRAHEHHIKVFGATLTPYEGADYFSQDGEAVRQAVNQWIRTSGKFDGVVDFDAAVRDPAHPSQFRPEYQSGDHLHPSAAGYKAMADAIDLAPLLAGVP
jgi:lysophospholipase L1-like esterase